GTGDASHHALALTVGASQFTVEKNLLHTNVLVDRLLPVALTEPGITQLVQMEILHVETIKRPLVDVPIESDRHTMVADGNEPLVGHRRVLEPLTILKELISLRINVLGREEVSDKIITFRRVQIQIAISREVLQVAKRRSNLRPQPHVAHNIVIHPAVRDSVGNNLLNPGEVLAAIACSVAQENAVKLLRNGKFSTP